MTKLLAFCPLNPNYPRLWGRTVQSIFRLEHDGPLDWLFVANDNPHERPYDNITHNYERARRAALEGGYDFLLTIESDMVVPPGAIDQLLACDADVAYGLYVFRHGRRTWSAYTTLEERHGVSLSEDAPRARREWGKVIDVAGVGLGCALISRKVLRTIDFRMGDNDRVSNDWQFALNLQEAGYSQRAHLGVVCGHHSYKPWPQIIWPDPDAQTLYRVESLGDAPTVAPGERMSVRVGMGVNSIHREAV